MCPGRWARVVLLFLAAGCSGGETSVEGGDAGLAVKPSGFADASTPDAGAPSRPDAGRASGMPGRHLCPIPTDGLANGYRYAVYFYGSGAVIGRTLELQSCGDQPAQVLSAGLEGASGRPPSGKFELIAPSLPVTLAPGQRLSYELRYHADQYGEVNDVAVFRSDTGPEPIEISLLGNTRPTVRRIPCRLNSTTAPCDLGIEPSGTATDGTFQASITGDPSCRVHMEVESTPAGAWAATRASDGASLPLDGAPPAVLELRRTGANATGLLRLRGLEGTTGPECFLEL